VNLFDEQLNSSMLLKKVISIRKVAKK